MRVLHAISGIDPRNGGPTSALIGLASAQVRAGLNVRVISTWKELDAFRSAEKLESLGVGVRMVGPARGKMSRHPILKAALQEEIAAADILHVHAIWEQIQHQACRAAQFAEIPYVYTPHGMLDRWNMTKNSLAKSFFLALRMRRNLNRAALLHFTTEIESESASRLKLTAPRIVEPLGIDLKEFNLLPTPGSFRSKHSMLGDRPIVLFLGRVHYGKGLELLAPALARMRTNAVLVVAGPDADGYSEKINALAGTARDRILYVGMLSGAEKLAAMVDAAVLALPSYHENFGLAVIEALACGTPVVVSDQVNLYPQIRAAGVGGVVPLDVEKLAAELDRWLGDNDLRERAGEKGMAMVRASYSWDAIAAHWVEHYGRLMHSSKPAGGGTE